MGITLGELVFDIGGGIPDGKAFKAVQTGGPSGGCIPAKYLNTPHRLRVAEGARLDHGLGRPDRPRRGQLHGQHGQVLPRILARGIVRPVRPLPRRPEADARPAGEDHQRPRAPWPTWSNSRAWPTPCAPPRSAAWARRRPTRSSRPSSTSSTSTSSISRIKNARAGVCAALFAAPCVNACPAGVDAASYVSHMGDGRRREAYFQHMENNPFPIVCGRVCPAFCEKKCSRGKYDEALAIREVKRLFADWAIEEGLGFPRRPGIRQGEGGHRRRRAGRPGLRLLPDAPGLQAGRLRSPEGGRRHDEGRHPRFPPAQGQAAGRDRGDRKSRRRDQATMRRWPIHRGSA